MIKLMIEKIDKNNYFLKDKDDNKYRFHIQFYDLDKNPEVGDVLYVNEKLLDSGSYLFSFGPLISKFGKNMTSTKDPDLIVLAMGDEKKYLKRYYG